MSDTVQTQRCYRCERDLPLDAFQRSFSNKGNARGLEGRCRECRLAEQRERRMSKSPEERSAIARRTNLWVKYKITVEEYDAKLEAQNGVCAICGEGPRYFRNGKLLPLCVDHDHKTGENRDLLCGPCNALVGMAMEDQDRLLSALAYVRKWGVL